MRDRYQQFSATARELLSDFREVEENFRKLDRQLREQIAGWNGAKGELLDDMLGSRETIAGSDQGKSFHAFYDFLLSQARQEELSELLGPGPRSSPSIAERDPRLRHIHYDWLDAAERTQATVRQLSEQLRRFLDDQVWFENRRVIDILRGIEARALSCATTAGRRVTIEIDGPSPAITLPMERPLYTPGAQGQRSTATPSGRRARTTDPAGAVRPGPRRPGPLRGERPPRAAPAARRSALAELISEQPLEQGAGRARDLPVAADGLSRRLRRGRSRAGQLAGRGRPGEDRHLPGVIFARTVDRRCRRMTRR